ncbi:MAG TPA: hypothetical protein VN580_06995 [Clostridia bacterium]|nr:hypothetical protein [Clostridia bacterium]
MQQYKASKWAEEIISMQTEEGSWGYFHTLSNPVSRRSMTTEQALRRLQVLGYTIDDPPVRRAVEYLHACLEGKKQIPDRREKLHDWDIFTALMFSTWIRRFTAGDILANNTAAKWAEVISCAFTGGAYEYDSYARAYRRIFGLVPRGGRIVDFVTFYQVSIIAGMLDKGIEPAMFDYILEHTSGIYYIYEGRLSMLPEGFKSKQAGRYLGAIELLSEYKNPACRRRLSFVAEWIKRNKEPYGLWDMGPAVKDGVHFPLSDSWRSIESRELDCTYRIKKLLADIEMHDRTLSIPGTD